MTALLGIASNNTNGNHKSEDEPKQVENKDTFSRLRAHIITVSRGLKKNPKRSREHKVVEVKGTMSHTHSRASEVPTSSINSNPIRGDHFGLKGEN